MEVAQEDGTLTVKRPTDRGEDRALHGLTRSLIANMVEGVTKGFEKKLEIQGVGYRASLRGTALELNVGFSHSVVKDAPAGITYDVPTPTEIVVKGIDKQQVGQIAAEIRKVRPPEPYKGKGIRYEGEYVRRKVGKRAGVLQPRASCVSGGIAGCAARSPVPRSVRASPCSGRTWASPPSSSTTSPARRSRPQAGST
jgi:large subunit ribosomal protein L6